MSNLYLLYRNILESSTVTVTNEDAAFPKWRLHDRDVGKLFKGTGAADHTIKADQGASVSYDVDTLIIPSSHSLTSGDQLDWEYSANDSDWSDMVTAWAGATGQIVKEAVASQTKRYWRLVLTSLAALPELPELWMGKKMELTDALANPAPREGLKGNVERIDSLSGRPFFLTLGGDRQYRNYSCIIEGASLKADLESFLTHSRGKPFWVKDVDGTWLFMSLVDPNIGTLEKSPTGAYWRFNLEMIQVLA